MPQRRSWWWGILVFALLLGAGEPTAAEEKWGPFRGKVVDAETGQPIQGAVFLMIWYKLVYAVVQTNMEFYDAKEAVSGADGTFEIPRLSPPFFSFRITRYGPKVFAPGYAEHRWVVTPPTGEALVDFTVVEMRRLRTRQERLEALTIAVLPSVPDEKKPFFTQAVIRERKNLGLDP
jgi:hypothetical protein